MKIKEVYEFYQEFVKPIYSEIEARWNDIPVELLFETYASFDHVKRYYIDEEDEHTASMKALSHLKRGVLDAFKLKLKYFNTDIEKFLDSSIDFQLIDNGEFISSLYRDRQHIIGKAKEARLLESKDGKEKSFEGWFDVSLSIDEFEKKYFQHTYKVNWAKNKTFQWLTKDLTKGFVVGILSGGLSSYLIWWVTS
jgi:hypothetical protein